MTTGNAALASFGPARAAGWLIAAAAGAAGAWYGFDFGLRAGGLWLGVVAAANSAAMGMLLASALLDRLARLGRA